MREKQGADGSYSGMEAGAVLQGMEPTQSFPIQAEPVQAMPMPVVQPSYAMAQPVNQASGVSFPGLPTIGGGGGNILQQTVAAPMMNTSQYLSAQPQTASMNMAAPYGNYTTQSQYLPAQPSMYSQPQLGMTTNLSQFQPNVVQYR